MRLHWEIRPVGEVLNGIACKPVPQVFPSVHAVWFDAPVLLSLPDLYVLAHVEGNEATPIAANYDQKGFTPDVWITEENIGCWIFRYRLMGENDCFLTLAREIKSIVVAC